MKEIIWGQGAKKNHTIKTRLKWKMCELRIDLRGKRGGSIVSTNGFLRGQETGPPASSAVGQLPAEALLCPSEPQPRVQ